MQEDFDWRKEPSVTVVDIYTRSGHHLRSYFKLSSGRIIYEEGRQSCKDVGFMPQHIRLPWEEFLKNQ